MLMRLPFNLKTFTNTYQPEAFISGIVFAKGQKHLPYFLSNYIRIMYNKDAAVQLGYYNDNHLLKNDGLIKEECGFIPMRYAVQGIDLAQIAVRALDNGKYVFGAFNDGCIPGKSAYPAQYYWHDYLLYGYEGDAFISAAYLKDQHYKEFKINMQDYNRAMIIKESDVFIYMLTYDEESPLGFDLPMVKWKLTDYVTSKRLSEDDAIYGISAFRWFADDIEYKADTQLDMRYVCFAWEHKNLMRMRLEYMRYNGYISLSHDVAEQYAEMAKRLHQGVMLAIKYNITHDKHILERLAQTLRESAEQDERVLGDILARL